MMYLCTNCNCPKKENCRTYYPAKSKEDIKKFGAFKCEKGKCQHFHPIDELKAALEMYDEQKKKGGGK